MLKADFNRDVRIASLTASVIYLVVFLSPAAIGQPPVKGPLDDLPAAQWMITDAWPEDRKPERPPRMAARAPEVFAPENVRSYARRMRLSDAQKTHLAGLYAAYRAGVDQLYEKHGPRISELAVSLAIDANYDFDYVADFVDLRNREQAYERELVTLEDLMFADLLLVLAEDQWPLLEGVQLHRCRARCFRFDVQLYEARIDLTSLTEKAQLSTDTLIDIEPMLLEYERVITPLWMEIHEQADRSEVEKMRLVAMLQYRDDGTLLDPLANDADRAQSVKAQADRERLNAASVPKQQQLGEINQTFLPRVLALLPEDAHRRVHAEFLREANPRIYPDHHDPRDLMEVVLATLPEDSDIRPLIRTAWDDYRAKYDAMTSDMVEGVRRWITHMAKTDTSDFADVTIVREARFKRWEASEKFVDQMIGLLPPETAAALEKQVHDYRQTLNSEREREKEPRMANP